MKRMDWVVIVAVASMIVPCHRVADMGEGFARNAGLYTPHVDNCDSSEVCISVGGGDLGYCIEEDERAALQWKDAQHACVAEGK